MCFRVFSDLMIVQLVISTERSARTSWLWSHFSERCWLSWHIRGPISVSQTQLLLGTGRQNWWQWWKRGWRGFCCWGWICWRGRYGCSRRCQSLWWIWVLLDQSSFKSYVVAGFISQRVWSDGSSGFWRLCEWWETSFPFEKQRSFGRQWLSSCPWWWMRCWKIFLFAW